MFRYRLRTLMIVLALTPPIVAFGVRESLRFRRAFAAVAERQDELAMAKSANNGSKSTTAGVRHAQLRLNRQDETARRDSVAYRIVFPVAPK
jgi:hypothetical protein